MVPVSHGAGPDLAAKMEYVTHDIGSRDTADRVAWTLGVNLPVDDAPTCEKLMLRTVRDAAALKAAAGVATNGRKLKKPFEHLSLSWDPDEPRPTRRQMVAAAHEALEARGYSGCQAFIACHMDRDHPHVHILVCRVDPQTGRTRKPAHLRKLQRWAENYEERHGGLRIPNRRERRLVREHNAREIEAAVKENRKPALRRMPAMEPKRTRGHDGRVIRQRPARDRREWVDLRSAQDRDTATPAAEKRAARSALNRRQTVRRHEDLRRRADRAKALADRASRPAPAPEREPARRPRPGPAALALEPRSVWQPKVPARPARPRPGPAALALEPRSVRQPKVPARPARPRPGPAALALEPRSVRQPKVPARPARPRTRLPAAPPPAAERQAAAERRERLQAAARLRRFLDAVVETERQDLDGAAAELVARQRRDLPWEDVRTELDARSGHARYYEECEGLPVGQVRIDLETAMVDRASAYAPRGRTRKRLVAAVRAVVDDIQAFVDGVINSIIDTVLPGRGTVHVEGGSPPAGHPGPTPPEDRALLPDRVRDPAPTAPAQEGARADVLAETAQERAAGGDESGGTTRKTDLPEDPYREKKTHVRGADKGPGGTDRNLPPATRDRRRGSGLEH